MRPQRRTELAILLGLCMSAAAFGCGPPPEPEEPKGDPLAPANLYPLAEGNVWSYNVDTGQDLPTLGQTRVVSGQGNRYEVSSNRSDPVIYEVREQGIFRPANGTWLLKAPIEVGAEWPSSAGMTARVESTGVSVETKAGSFDGCVQVVETGGEAGRSVATVYCPEIGPVLVESKLRTQVSRMEAKVTARLLGYAFGQERKPAPE